MCRFAGEWTPLAHPAPRSSEGGVAKKEWEEIVAHLHNGQARAVGCVFFESAAVAAEETDWSGRSRVLQWRTGGGEIHKLRYSSDQGGRA